VSFNSLVSQGWHRNKFKSGTIRDMHHSALHSARRLDENDTGATCRVPSTLTGSLSGNLILEYG